MTALRKLSSSITPPSLSRTDLFILIVEIKSFFEAIFKTKTKEKHLEAINHDFLINYTRFTIIQKRHVQYFYGKKFESKSFRNFPKLEAIQFITMP